MDIVIKIPQKLTRHIRDEYYDAKARGLDLNFKASTLPTDCKYPDKVYFCWRINGKTRIWGFHVLNDLIRDREAFICLSTGVKWTAGKYIIRYGDTLQWLEKPIMCRDFRSWSYYKNAIKIS